MQNEPKDIEISIRNLKKSFGELVAVDDLSLDIYRGEILGFLGPNGAGKTTTINMICGLSPANEGEIIFHDEASEKGVHSKNRLGVCPQENVFWPKLTCREQLIFMAEMYNVDHETARKKSDELLEFLGLKEKASVLAKKLSGGMKRRLSIALALVHDPDILVLDEPEAGLDPQSRILVRDFIKTLAREKTIILTTHNMDEADRMSDRVAIIDYGKLLHTDSPENLKKSIGVGDILEYAIDDLTGAPEGLITDLKKTECEVKMSDETILVQSKEIIRKVSRITEIIKSHGLTIREMTIRENTLEDVFISLTGRKLRQ
jgi:ABC-2 type transport system ATP-binding protein